MDNLSELAIPDNIKEILNIKGNGKCVDCGASSPDWTSLTYGVFLCINCCGHHRKLGTHISMCKSLKYDDIKNDELERLRMCGNEKLLEVFEANNLVESSIETKYTDRKVVEYAHKIHNDYPIERIPDASSLLNPEDSEKERDRIEKANKMLSASERQGKASCRICKVSKSKSPVLLYSLLAVGGLVAAYVISLAIRGNKN